MNPLDQYAKIEPLLGFYEEYDSLYTQYITTLRTLKPQKILDIGSGNGCLLARLQKEGFQAEGIERSKEMIRRSKGLGIKATCKELKDFKAKSFDCALAVGDVLNYMPKSELKEFFSGLEKITQVGGFFLADINTLAGFELSEGVMSSENETQFLNVEGSFDGKALKTDFTLFEKEKELYKKSSFTIKQYYHSLEVFKELQNFELLDIKPISMFSDEEEKLLMVFHKAI